MLDWSDDSIDGTMALVVGARQSGASNDSHSYSVLNVGFAISR